MPAKRTSNARESSQKTASQPPAEVAPHKTTPDFHLSEGETVIVPPKPYVFVRGTGEFMTAAPKAWGTFHASVLNIVAPVKDWQCATAFMDESKEGEAKFAYRAGATVHSIPEAALPADAELGTMESGAFVKFTLTGGYEHLGEAWGIAMERARGMPGIEVESRPGFEHYHDASACATATVTDIYIPIKAANAEFSVSKALIVDMPARTYVGIEMQGVFKEIADKVWHKWHMELLPKLGRENVHHSYGVSSGKSVNDKGEATGVYCAGSVLKDGVTVPAEVASETKTLSLSGKHLQVTMVGDYENITVVWPHVLKLAHSTEGYAVDDSRPCLEKYVVDPFTNASPKQWITQFFVPMKVAATSSSN